MKKCEYCNGKVDERKNLLDMGDMQVYIDGNNNLTSDDGGYWCDDIKINYCPMCGKKLD